MLGLLFGCNRVNSTTHTSYASQARLSAANGAGNDAISGFEHLTGGSGNDRLIGTDAANTLTGLGGDDRLNGGAGADKLLGGDGNDTYIVDDVGDTVTEAADEGVADLVQSSVAFTLGDNIENLTLTGSAIIAGTGNGSDNIITGNGVANTLTGGAGDDRLDGGLGADKLLGGEGNDTYIIDNAGEIVTELAAEGDVDLVQSSVTFTLGANVENLKLMGAVAVNGTGNALNNAITGNGMANVLTGVAGNDTLNGGLGSDTLNGGTGADMLVGGGGIDTATYASDVTGVTVSLMTGNGVGGDADGDSLTGITNLTGGLGNDTLEGNASANTLIGGANGADGDTLSYANAGAGVTVSLMGVGAQATGGAGNDTISAFEHLTGGSGNDRLTGTGAANTLTGLGGDDRINGGAGADKLLGGDGNDTYIVDNIGDVVTEATSAGDADLVHSSVAFTLGDNIENLTLTGALLISGTGNGLTNIIIGNGVANTLTGSAGNDRLDGGLGADKLLGGDGNDTYVVNVAADAVTENDNEGDADLVLSAVSYTLGANLEKLTLTGAAVINGAGNGLDNAITGNGVANVLTGRAGNDTLNGGLGSDTLNGGTGADTLIGGGGIDTVTYASDTTGVTVSLMTGTGVGGDADEDSLTGIANLTGGIGNDTLEGHAGANTLTGGAGNDTVSYANSEGQVTVNLAITTAQATSGAGSDTISGFERLIGSNWNDKLIGSTGGDFISGGGGWDEITGGAGADTLRGDGGDDLFRYTGPNAGADTILDFGTGQDKILIVKSGFGIATAAALGTGNANDCSALFHCRRGGSRVCAQRYRAGARTIPFQYDIQRAVLGQQRQRGGRAKADRDAQHGVGGHRFRSAVNFNVRYGKESSCLSRIARIRRRGHPDRAAPA